MVYPKGEGEIVPSEGKMLPKKAQMCGPLSLRFRTTAGPTAVDLARSQGPQGSRPNKTRALPFDLFGLFKNTRTPEGLFLGTF